MNIRTGMLMAILLCALPPTGMLAQVPEHATYVNDYAGILQPVQQQALNAKLYAYQQQSGVQFVIVIPKSLDGLEIREYAQKIADTWKIGQKGKDNGLLLVRAPHEKKNFLEVGYGLEGTLNDAAVGDILRAHLKPHLGKGESYEGLNETVDAVIAKLGPHPDIQGRVTPKEEDHYGYYLLFGLVLFFTIGIVLYVVHHHSPEPSDEDNSNEDTDERSRTDSEKLDRVTRMGAASIAAEELHRRPRSKRSDDESLGFAAGTASSSSFAEDAHESTSTSTNESYSEPSFDSGGGDMGGGGAGVDG
jgi:uncharacterized protein